MENPTEPVGAKCHPWVGRVSVDQQQGYRFRHGGLLSAPPVRLPLLLSSSTFLY